jgi:hypothetical protein
VVELADLIALRQIGVEVVLAVEPRPLVDLRADGHAGAHRLADALRLGTGSMPGMAASISETWVLGSAPKAVAEPENSLALEVTWA